MIERWFPSAEVTEASSGGWGSGNAEKALFTWFAARPLAQAKAAMVTSLLPWPDDEEEQQRLQTLVRQSLVGLDANQLADREAAALVPDRLRDRQRAAADDELRRILSELYPGGARTLDPFSGRGMIPLEAIRLGARATGIDYSPVATLAGQLLADYPFRDWTAEPDLPIAGYAHNPLDARLPQDVEAALGEVGRRFEAEMSDFFPTVAGKRPWGYVWAVTLPCQECGRRFPLVGVLELRRPNDKKGDPGQSFYIDVDRGAGTFSVVVHEGAPTHQPTRIVAPGKHKYDSSGKVAVCPFCSHVHPKDVHTRLASEGLGQDHLLIVSDISDDGVKTFRLPTVDEESASEAAAKQLAKEDLFEGGLVGVPDELIPEGNTWTIQPSVYGAKTYGDLCCDRQSLGFVRLARVITDVGRAFIDSGVSEAYTRALVGYAGAVLVRKLRRSTRGSSLEVMPNGGNKVKDLFGSSESSISFSYDFFETGIGGGPGSWDSLASFVPKILTRLTPADSLDRHPGAIQRGSALALALPDDRLDAVVTDPPYDAMIDYSDASDLFFVWLKRALGFINPELLITADRHGVQEKDEEIIVKKGGGGPAEHRTRTFFDEKLAVALTECNRVVKQDGVVTIVFGHGDPDVWRRLLGVIDKAGLVLTGSWPAQTESGGQEGSANITTTLTMSCRPAALDRPVGKAMDVRSEIRAEVFKRVAQWERDGLAITDQLMAAAGPAMEVAGRYSEVLDSRGESVDRLEFVKTARQAVEEHIAIQVEDVPLSSFDAITRFALFWVRLHGRSVAAKSDARWQAMAAELTLDELKAVLHTIRGGVRLAMATESKAKIDDTSPLIEVLFALARAWGEGLDAVAEVMAASGREDADDHQLFAAMAYLASRLPEGDADRQAWISLARNRRGLATRTAANVATRRQQAEAALESNPQMQLTFEQEN
jgi:putative DNA methylase